MIVRRKPLLRIRLAGGGTDLDATSTMLARGSITPTAWSRSRTSSASEETTWEIS